MIRRNTEDAKQLLVAAGELFASCFLKLKGTAKQSHEF